MRGLAPDEEFSIREFAGDSWSFQHHQLTKHTEDE